MHQFGNHLISTGRLVRQAEQAIGRVGYSLFVQHAEDANRKAVAKIHRGGVKRLALRGGAHSDQVAGVAQ
ncbi:MAG TPA: hypothetical protein VMU81_30085 [Acetobacteraceae bacterium]|nr:hypothetical protein [Acetobacteraceae bacterium]